IGSGSGMERFSGNDGSIQAPARGTLVKSFTNRLRRARGGGKVPPHPAAARDPMASQSPELTHAAYDSKIEGNVIFTRVDAAINWMRKNSLWPMPMGLACCAIELMATASSRFDISRFGAEVMRFSPRQSDVMIVAGTVTYKMALAVRSEEHTSELQSRENL